MKRILSVAVLTLLAACSDSTGPEGQLRVTTGQRVYALPAGNVDGVLVSFTVTNTSGATMQLAPCGPMPTGMLDRRQGVSWAVVNSGFCPLSLYTGPLELAPGGSITGTVNVEPQAGTYRVRVPLTGSTEGRFGVSPSFEVRSTDG